MKKLVCLVMMIRNEARSIRDVLQSIKPHVDQWLILDTGSTDGSQDIVREVMGDLPGKLVEEPFINVAQTKGWAEFEHIIDYGATRNRALDLAAQLDDPAIFSFMNSGDEYLRDGAALREHLEQHRESSVDCHFIGLLLGEAIAPTPRVFRTGSAWKYVDELHEFPTHPDPAALTTGVPKAWVDHVVTDHESRYDGIWERHVPILRKRLEVNPNDERALIFLAQSYEAVMPFFEPEERQALAAEALDLYCRRLALPTGNEVERCYVGMQMLDTARVSGLFTDKQLFDWAESLFAENPKRPELALMRAELSMKIVPLQRVYELARAAAEIAVEVRSGTVTDSSPVSTSCLWQAHRLAAVAAKQLAAKYPDKFDQLAHDHVQAGLAAGGTWEVFKDLASASP
jgi:hypothetical protein